MLPTTPPTALPPVLAGPLLRRLEPTRLVLWLVGSRALALTLRLQPAGSATLDLALDPQQCQVIPVGRHAFIHLIDVALDDALPLDLTIAYDLLINDAEDSARAIADWAPHLLYGDAGSPEFVLHSRIDNLLHGSCRKPHHPSADGLLCVDRLLAQHPEPAQRPALLMMSGDQVYADDVAGPMLRAVHALIERLGLFDEELDGAVVADSQALYRHGASYYQRAELLPALKSNETLRERFFGGVKKPIFTSSNADNHLVTFAEVLAMYLLVWSPLPWTLITPQPPQLTPEQQTRYTREQQRIDDFVQGLKGAARVFAHLSCLMIFDDHDITDDWNLSAQWEETAYGHPFSKRIIGNALLAYMLCQGWGNNPDAFAQLLEHTRALSATAQTPERMLECQAQNDLIDQLLGFQQWQYVLPSTPALVVLDTRTRRWRSESNLGQPSGLLDWEALSELQHELLDHPSAIIVSPAPIFGVKLIETVQKVFSWCGYPLLVDAENWMAHRGSAQVILNIFRHSRTPGSYVILSGHVHYSFVYEVLIRHRQGGPRIWQITSSGIKNEFPAALLEWEALSELQHELLDHPSAIIVSPAPIFGVKLIETVQKVFSWCGYPLLVDAENWMAHRGSAQVILNIFRHSRTPGSYVILSGHVHYSFVYEVLIRHRQGGPRIWQITSSGIKNEFPAALLEWFDRLNRWLYSPRSPLNWFTKRRRMKVMPHVPEHAEAGERLWNSSGIGQVFFNEQGQPVAIYQHNANGAAPTRMIAPR
ncbi:alkaline phosphatase family protein [Pseudomonas protegens]|uniref:alkaline phosphatase family protein n=1 Tax=Pseudomonas protegens TaxID=380021 RepID=UPI0024C46FE8|nr:alkaline phosphatase family protein [Pseudomonas protegens]MDK1396543.1 alkaline phosphatase family protein [Pseudomonas protegens]